MFSISILHAYAHIIKHELMDSLYGHVRKINVLYVNMWLLC